MRHIGLETEHFGHERLSRREAPLPRMHPAPHISLRQPDVHRVGSDFLTFCKCVDDLFVFSTGSALHSSTRRRNRPEYSRSTDASSRSFHHTTRFLNHPQNFRRSFCVPSRFRRRAGPDGATQEPISGCTTYFSADVPNRLRTFNIDVRQSEKTSHRRIFRRPTRLLCFSIGVEVVHVSFRLTFSNRRPARSI